MESQIVQIGQVIDVIDLNLKAFTLFKVILDIEALDPCRTEIVTDDLGQAELVPLRASLAVEHYHAVGACESVQVWKILAAEGQSDGRYKSTLVRIDALVDGCEHRIVKVSARV